MMQRLVCLAALRAVLSRAQVERLPDESTVTPSLVADDECASTGCGLSALQVRARRSGSGGAARDPAVCHTAQKGSDCWNKTAFAFGTGIYEHPEWYSKQQLTTKSSFEDFMAAEHLANKTACPYLPCSCYTAQEGEPCYEKIVWNKYTGIYENPGWYAGLTSSSSLADFQKSVHKEDPSLCPMPCAEGTCHTAAEGEPCYKNVMWIMSSGIFTNPDWFPGLSPQSTFEEVQEFYRQKHPKACPAPCNDWHKLH